LKGSAVDAVGHADIERAGIARHDVDEILVLAHVPPADGGIGRMPCDACRGAGMPGVLRFAQDDNYRGIFGLLRMTMLVCGNSERKTRQGELFVVSR